METRNATVFLPVLILALSCLLLGLGDLAGGEPAGGTDSREAVFRKTLAEALKTGDRDRMRQLVLGAGADAFRVASEESDRALAGRAEGDPFGESLANAMAIAEVIAETPGRDGLLKMVDRFKGFTPAMARERRRGMELEARFLKWVEQGGPTGPVDLVSEALSVYRALGDRIGEHRLRMLQGSVLQKAGRPADALTFFQAARDIARDLGDAYGEGTAVSRLAKVKSGLGQHDESAALYREMVEITRRTGNSGWEGGAFLLLGASREKAGRLEESLGDYRSALSAFRSGKGMRAEEAETLAIIGTLLYRMGRYAEALEPYREALDIYRSRGDARGEIDALEGAAMVLLQIGRVADAVGDLRRVLDLQRSAGDLRGQAGTLNRIGFAQIGMNRFADALESYRQALDLRRKLGDVDGEANTLGAVATCEVYLGREEEALEANRRALEIARGTGNAARTAQSLLYRGVVKERLGRLEEAEEDFRQSLEANRSAGDKSWDASILWSLGNVQSRLGRYDEALESFRKGIGHAQRTGDLSAEAGLRFDAGLASISRGDLPEALRLFRESLEISGRTGEQGPVWRAQWGLGNVQRASGRGEEAVAHFRSAAATIERLYAGSHGMKDEERSSAIGATTARVYRQYLDLLIDLFRNDPGKGYDREAFAVAERGKSRSFQEAMAKAGARAAAGGDEEFRATLSTEQELLGRLSSLRTAITNELSRPEKARREDVLRSLRERLTSEESKLQEHERTLESKYPRYADLKRPKALTVEELQGLLLPGETVVSYAVGEERAAAFVVSRDRFRLVDLAVGRKELGSLVRDFRQGLEGVREYKDLERFRPESSHDLYGKVFAPVEEALGTPRVLYVSGDDVLHTVPFEALVDRAWDGKRFREARRLGRSGEGALLGEFATLSYLGDRYTMSYLPSASVLRSLRKYGKKGYGKWERALVAFADPVFGEEKEREGVAGSERGSAPGAVPGGKAVATRGVSGETALSLELLTRSTGGAALARLKESSEEARSIASAVGGGPGDLYLRERATEENVYVAPLREARYVLFSTHGLLGGDFTGVAEPSLALTLTGNPPGRDGFLSMSEVLGLDLNADLVILSACNTSGKGEKAGSGEGFAGLTRSFMYAGGRSLLVTHWSVESASARDLMVSALGRMKVSGKASALVEAKRVMRGSVRKEGGQEVSLSHPFFWAPFVLVGEGE